VRDAPRDEQDKPLLVPFKKQAGKDEGQRGRGKGKTAESKVKEVVWPSGSQVPEHNLEQLADTDIDIVSRNLPKVHNIASQSKFSSSEHLNKTTIDKQVQQDHP